MLEETFKRLKDIMTKTHDINWKWIEKETNISARTINRWMKEEHKPHPVLFSKLKIVVDRLYDLTYGGVTSE